MKINKRPIPAFVSYCLLPALLIATDSPARAADLLITVVEQGSQHPMPTRLRVRDADGKDRIPENAQMLRIGVKDKWFISGGRSRLNLPAGKIEIRAEHGPEYAAFKKHSTSKKASPTPSTSNLPVG